MKEEKYLQELNPVMLHVDRNWFNRDLEELEKSSISNISAWLRKLRALMCINKREEEQTNKNQ
jgi:hypothetical protein